MASLSARRNSSTAGSTSGGSVSSRPSVCSRLSSLNEEQALEPNGAADTNSLVSSLLSRKVRLCSDRSDSGFSETCANMSRDDSFDCVSTNLGRTPSIGSQQVAAEKGWGVDHPDGSRQS